MGWTVTTKSDGTNAKKLPNNWGFSQPQGLEDFARKGHMRWSPATGPADQVRHRDFLEGFWPKIFILLVLLEFWWSWDATPFFFEAAVVLFQMRLCRNIHLKNSLRKSQIDINLQNSFSNPWLDALGLRHRCPVAQIVGPPIQTSSKTFIFDWKTILARFWQICPVSLVTLFWFFLFPC